MSHAGDVGTEIAPEPGGGVVRPALSLIGLFRGCEVVVECPVRHLRSHRDGDFVSGAEVDAGVDARVDGVLLDLGGNVVVPCHSRRGGREIEVDQPVLVQL